MQTDIPVKNCILTGETIKRSIRRMAFQVAENNADEPSIIVAGVVGNGRVLAAKLISELKQIISASMDSIDIDLNKKEPLNAVVSSGHDFNDKVIIVVDDVSNTGKTLLYALKPFLHFQPKKIQTLVLVERSHKLFAVQPDYVGLSVATTLQEHISVETEGEEIVGAWLH
jgi:pyrimidine operon attenuation protein/uracil phosphoribosyltransferase